MDGRPKVSNPLLPIGDGHTELTDDDRHGLMPTYITTRGELFDAEQRNIAKALLRRAPDVDRLLDDTYLRNLHRAMFEDVWDWAGRYRLRETNLGIDPKHPARQRPPRTPIPLPKRSPPRPVFADLRACPYTGSTPPLPVSDREQSWVGNPPCELGISWPT